jgi:hypothetical protein
LRQDQSYDIGITEELGAEVCAERHGIALAANIIEGLETVRSSRAHARVTASSVPALADLKVSTTIAHSRSADLQVGEASSVARSRNADLQVGEASSVAHRRSADLQVGGMSRVAHSRSADLQVGPT